MASNSKLTSSWKEDSGRSYLDLLQPDAKGRYVRKLTIDNGSEKLPDPYSLSKSSWTNDPYAWPKLSFAQVFMYLIETPAMFNPQSMKAYKSLEAYKYVESGHVKEVLYHDVVDTPYCFLKAPVTPSMRINDKPHQPWICLNKDTADVYCAHCTCLAGLGEMCSHIAAVLFKVELAVRFGWTEKCVTSEACKWNQCFRKQLELVTVDELQSKIATNRKHPVQTTTPSGKDPLPSEDVLNELKAILPSAAFFSLIPSRDEDCDSEKPSKKTRHERYPQTITSIYRQEFANLTGEELHQTCLELFDSYSITTTQISNLHDATKSQSISQLWYQHRQGRITASKVHDVMSRRETTDPTNLTKRIMGYNSYNLKKKAAVRWGIDHESEARTVYEEFQQKHHKQFSVKDAGFMVSKKALFMGASADGIISCECCGMGCLEIKCPHKHRDVSIQEAAAMDKDFCLTPQGTLKLSHRYYTQVQCQLAVYELSFADFVVYTKPTPNASLSIARLCRDDIFCERMFACASQFFFANVLPEIVTRRLERDVPVIEPDNQDSVMLDATLYCICQEPEYGRMIQCDNKKCDLVWFHYKCVNVRRKPSGKWYCPQCTK